MPTKVDAHHFAIQSVISLAVENLDVGMVLLNVKRIFVGLNHTRDHRVAVLLCASSDENHETTPRMSTQQA
jgi:hypothetical protein